MNASRPLAVIYILLLAACIDQLQYPIDLPQNLPISVSGHITNEPGPYTVHLNSSFDIQSTVDLKVPISAKHINLLDELGNNEQLVEVRAGVYQTSTTQGRIGGIYKLRIEFFDGRIYESIPDTITAPGKIDSLYYQFNSAKDYLGITSYGFDVFVNGQGNDRNDIRYMWSMTSTFKAITHPELFAPLPPGECYPIPEQLGKCNRVPLCTGLRNMAPRNSLPIFERVGPCECCTCWYKIFNNAPILSDDVFTGKGNYQRISIYTIPLSEWMFMFKIHVQVSQVTLTKHAFDFFKSIQSQKEATGSLFQPITGKIPSTFLQVSGTPTPISGIFYAAGSSTKSKYITPEDVPYPIIVPEVDFEPRGLAPGFGWISCLELFPNATNVKPDFWED